jgi:biopolymer transport protein ExbD
VNIPSSRRAIQSCGFNLQLTPVIDCVFLLLIYFLWSSSFAAGELSLSGRLAPQASGVGAPRTNAPTAEPDFEPIVVRVIRRGSQIAWTIQDAPIPSLAELRQSFQNIAQIKPDVPITIRPSSDVPLGDVISAYDLARLAGLTKIQFAASELPGTEGPVER